jgi:hypothetical protein
MSLDVTVATADGERECERVIYRAALYLDDPGRRREVADLFTEDGVIEVPSTGKRVAGRAAIADYFGAFSPKLVSRRLSTNVLVEVDGERADATSYFAAFNLLGAGGPGMMPPPISQVGVYRDAFALEDGRWKIARRVVDVTYAEAVPKEA